MQERNEILGKLYAIRAGLSAISVALDRLPSFDTRIENARQGVDKARKEKDAKELYACRMAKMFSEGLPDMFSRKETEEPDILKRIMNDSTAPQELRDLLGQFMEERRKLYSEKCDFVQRTMRKEELNRIHGMICERLDRQADIVANETGCGYYSTGSLQEKLEYVQKARKRRPWRNGCGKDVIVEYIKQSSPARFEPWYKRALQWLRVIFYVTFFLVPKRCFWEFPRYCFFRSRLALAGMRYSLARLPCISLPTREEDDKKLSEIRAELHEMWDFFDSYDKKRNLQEQELKQKWVQVVSEGEKWVEEVQATGLRISENAEKQLTEEIALKEHHVAVTKRLYPTLVKQFGDFLDPRDWQHLDIVIYYVETGRADSAKEALQLLDRQKQVEMLAKVIATSCTEVSSSIRNGLQRIEGAMGKCFSTLSAQMNTQMTAVRKEIGAKLDMTSAQLRSLNSSVDFGNALRQKANEDTAKLLEDARYVANIAGDVRRVANLAEQSDIRRRNNLS